MAALIAAAIACGLRRWRFAVWVARAVVLAGPVLLLVSVLMFIVLPLGRQEADPSVKATVLANGISGVMNCGGPAFAAAFPAAALWALARWRLRATERADG